MSDRDETNAQKLEKGERRLDESEDASREVSSPKSQYIGRVLDERYKITDKIGQGGMGQVFQANQLTLNRNVVIKLISENQLDDQIALQRFEREAQSLTRLDHTNIVTVYDFGRENGRAYIVMEYVEGQRLDHFVHKHEPLSGELFISIAGQLSNAVGEAHEVGLIHRDLKPGNIMLTQKNEREYLVKILDFGLAKLVSGDSDVTQDDKIVGSIPYLAPEQLTEGGADERVDVYAIGVVMYYMLTGEKPFQGSKASVLFDQVNTPPPPFSEKLSTTDHIPDLLERLVMRCLRKEPGERLQNAREVFEHLREASDHPNPISSVYTSASSTNVSPDNATGERESTGPESHSESQEFLGSSHPTGNQRNELETPVDTSVTVDKSAAGSEISTGEKTGSGPVSEDSIDATSPTPDTGVDIVSESDSPVKEEAGTSPEPSSSPESGAPSSQHAPSSGRAADGAPSDASSRAGERPMPEPNETPSRGETGSLSATTSESPPWGLVGGATVGVLALAGGVYLLIPGAGGEQNTDNARQVASSDSAEATETSAGARDETTDSSSAADTPDASGGGPQEALGTLRISGVSSGTLYIDGDQVGSVPTTTQVSPGEHRLEVRSDSGDQTWSQSITLGDGEERELQAEWAKRDESSQDESPSGRPPSDGLPEPSTGAPRESGSPAPRTGRAGTRRPGVAPPGRGSRSGFARQSG